MFWVWPPTSADPWAQEYGNAAYAWAVWPNRLNVCPTAIEGVSTSACPFCIGIVTSVTMPPDEYEKPATTKLMSTGILA
jgi:hypothetical protein